MTLLAQIFVWWRSQTLGTRWFTWRRGIAVGHDEQGNRYFHDKKDAHRWVIYNGQVEASKVPPQWHGWLHRTSDEIPTDTGQLPWQLPHQPNLTGTPQAHRPPGALNRATATPAGYQPWNPPRQASRQFGDSPGSDRSPSA